MNKPISLALLVGGIILIIYGVSASNSTACGFSRAVPLHPSLGRLACFVDRKHRSRPVFVSTEVDDRFHGRDLITDYNTFPHDKLYRRTHPLSEDESTLPSARLASDPNSDHQRYRS